MRWYVAQILSCASFLVFGLTSEDSELRRIGLGAALFFALLLVAFGGADYLRHRRLGVPRRQS